MNKLFLFAEDDYGYRIADAIAEIRHLNEILDKPWHPHFDPRIKEARRKRYRHYVQRLKELLKIVPSNVWPKLGYYTKEALAGRGGWENQDGY